MKHIYIALNWIFGVLFLLLGLLLLIQSTLGGMAFIIIALLLIPTVRSFAYSKTNKEIPVKARAISIFVLIIASFVFIGQSQKRESQKAEAQKAQVQAEKAAIEIQKTIDDFNANSVKILTDIREALNRGDLKEAVSLSSKYLVVENKELKELNSKAQSEMAAIEKTKKEAEKKAENAEKTEKALVELKSVPDSDIEKKRNLYKQLVACNSDIAEYKEKLSYYESKIKEKKEQERIEKEKLAVIAAAEQKELLKKAQGLSWNYLEFQDKMGRGTIKTAYISSINTVNFEFPYQGTQRATLRLRVHPKHGKDVILSIEKGQFLCDFNGCTVTVRFDEGKPQNFRTGRSADNDTTTVFISNYASFYSSAKKSKKIYIEATFYQQGTRVFEFDSANLKF